MQKGFPQDKSPFLADFRLPPDGGRSNAQSCSSRKTPRGVRGEIFGMFPAKR
jgi:hypothetical protein